MNFVLSIYIWPIYRLLSQAGEAAHADRGAQVHEVEQAAAGVHVRGSGGRKFLILRFPGEISYRCFTGCQKHF